MNLNLFFAMLGGLLVLAFIANRLVRFTGVPDVIILMVTGVLIGPVLHWVDPDLFRGTTQGFGSLALMLILFEGGLELNLREILSHFVGVMGCISPTSITLGKRGNIEQQHEAMLTFHGELAFLLRTFFFVLLWTRVDFPGLRQNVYFALGRFGALLVARWMTVEAGRPIWRDFKWRDREIMIWFLPRGLITAVLGINVLAARGTI